MAQMRAVLIRNGTGPVENLYMGDTAKPSAGIDHVLVKVKVFGLNRMDISQREGRYPLPPGASEILGVEFSGTVVEKGANVQEWSVGDEVLGLAGGGAYAEYVLVHTALLMKKPEHLSWVEAASIPEAFLTAYQALVQLGELQAGQDVLIHAGASGVGIAATQLARRYGARTVTVTASKSEKLDWLLSNPGATNAVNYTMQDFALEAKRTTGGKGVDVILDFVGQSYFEKNLDALALDGRMILLSLLSGHTISNASIAPILFKRLRIQGSTLRSRPLEYQAKLIACFSRNVLKDITGSSGQGPLKTYIHKVYPWTQIQDAHKELEGNKNIGKIVLEVI